MVLVARVLLFQLWQRTLIFRGKLKVLTFDRLPNSLSTPRFFQDVHKTKDLEDQQVFLNFLAYFFPKRTSLYVFHKFSNTIPIQWDAVAKYQVQDPLPPSCSRTSGGTGASRTTATIGAFFS